ncbi:hypothetical protein TOK_1177 [Pseudonocardia sp. N23]|nr:hypothetical protein TOK_1177 [Pseudonocardia sp. N23]
MRLSADHGPRVTARTHRRGRPRTIRRRVPRTVTATGP